MDSAVATDSPPAIRWLLPPMMVLVGALLLTMLWGHHAAEPASFHTVAILLVALATYAWTLYTSSVSVVLSLLILLLLVWAWALRPTAVLGADLGAVVLLMAVAGWQRRGQSSRLKRRRQILEDIEEERGVNEQAIALASQTHDSLQRKLARYTQLQTIAEELSNMTDLTSIVRLAVERAFTLIGKSDACLLFLIDAERQELSLVASKKRQTLPSIRAKHGDQFDRHVVRTHRPLLVNDVRRDFRFTVTLSAEREVSSVIACPLLLDQSAEGVLRLDSAQPNAYTQDDLRLLDIFLDLVSTAVTNARLFAQAQHLAVTDGLTGLMLRRPFLEHLTRELVRSGRSREPVSVLMLDVDHFKAYNDTYGHTAGDLVLKGVAGVLRGVVSSGGVVGRYGGEEFVVLLSRTARPKAGEIAETIRRLVPEQIRAPAVHRGAVGSAEAAVTVSIGVASFPDDAQVELELLRIADQRLYQAKRSGRNLVCAS